MQLLLLQLICLLLTARITVSTLCKFLVKVTIPFKYTCVELVEYIWMRLDENFLKIAVCIPDSDRAAEYAVQSSMERSNQTTKQEACFRRA